MPSDCVEPPRHGLVADDAVEPRPDARLVPAVMEARNCSKPAAEAFIDDHGRQQAERVVRARWRNCGRQRHQTGGDRDE